MRERFQPADTKRFDTALRRFDEENAQDPTREMVDGSAQPRELVYARRLTHWLLRLCPSASEALRLAARSQHLCRWSIPRDAYPLNRAGYLRWREVLKDFHAQKAGGILREVGYSQEVIGRVQSLILKSDFPQDPESRVLEDALCLVFLEHQFESVAVKMSQEKVVNALRKTWKKMSPGAQAIAAGLNYSPNLKALLKKASVT